MNKSVIIIGGGGHAAVLVDMLIMAQRQIIAYVAPTKSLNKTFENFQWLSADDDILTYSADTIELVNGIGSLPHTNLRTRLFNDFKRKGYTFASIISSNALISPSVSFEEGVQVFPGAIINSQSHIGVNSIINSGTIVEHDCIIGAHNHLAPKVALSGAVTTKDHVHIGTGANIIQAIHIGQNVTIGAGATVTQHIADHLVVYPAKVFIKKQAIKL